MPFPFALPTTAHLSFAASLTSSTHPSLPTAATSSRALVRDTLKRHKRLPAAQKPGNLSSVLNALNDYIPYLFALDAGLSNGSVCGEEVDVVLIREVESEWRACLSSRPVGREPQRVKVKSLEGELGFVLGSLGCTYFLLARAQLRPLYERAGAPLSEEQRKKAVATAVGYLLQAHAVFNYLLQRASGSAHAAQSESEKAKGTSHVADITPSTYSALASMALAEATLIAVLKDDPFPAAVADERNPNNKDWMFKGVEMPKVRAHLFARLCLAASEHAGRGLAAVRNTKGVDERLVNYLEDLKATARAKAMRFFGVDAEAQGKIGEGLAWLKAAKRELGFAEDEGRSRGFSRLKNSWKERREDRKVERGDAEWGSDAGRFEEGRVLEMLSTKWSKMNDTVSVQIVPSFDPLVSNMPSGRECHQPKPYEIPSLEEDVLARMRAPPEPSDLKMYGDEPDSAEDSDNDALHEPPGAFPGPKADYASNSAYY
ncbi:uncharacterized protein PV09_04852 [Verruconis gallopava]|uniref:pH-response regulator protein palC n=1 Tax=Verruconis gallopava TaxID=253628 RepID=A0A0D2AY31_9PEZI|nr:uncharacterized protein PV09_04852 [Verruconis gallopava]KIW04029.1 hypothetical protein PV09_04852 [Verruconis gallopava]